MGIVHNAGETSAHGLFHETSLYILVVLVYISLNNVCLYDIYFLYCHVPCLSELIFVKYHGEWIERNDTLNHA
jgi:hypothetical protein